MAEQSGLAQDTPMPRAEGHQKRRQSRCHSLLSILRQRLHSTVVFVEIVISRMLQRTLVNPLCLSKTYSQEIQPNIHPLSRISNMVAQTLGYQGRLL